MKFTIEIDPEINPNAVGEYLRSTFFNEQIQSATFGMTEAGNEPYLQVGCYSTFDWAEGVTPLEDDHVEEFTCASCNHYTDWTKQNSDKDRFLDYPGDKGPCKCTHEAHWTRGKKQVGLAHVAGTGQHQSVEIECRYFWDGDGTLVFILPEGQYLVNPDCKKDHGWYLTEDPEDF